MIRKLVLNYNFKGLSQQLVRQFGLFGGSESNLYTWGLYSSGVGYTKPNCDESLMRPQKLESINGGVAKVAMGKQHSAVVTKSGELYTFGCGDHGALGVDNSTNSYDQPRKVDFFSSKGLKVKDVAVGENHTVAVTNDNQVWTWGHGGKCGSALWSLLSGNKAGALGNGETNDRLSPGTIEATTPLGNVQSVSSGDDFVFVINDKNQVIHWGNGTDGALGDGYGIGVLTPTVNENFKMLQDKYKLTVQKIKSAEHSSTALLSDGKLYSWGRNNDGSLGIRQTVGVLNDASAVVPSPVIDDHYKGQKVVDFDLGENTLVLLTDQNQVFWSGLAIAYKPTRWNIPTDKKIIKVTASLNSVAALTEDGTIYSFNEFVHPFVTEPQLQYFKATSSELFGAKAKILDIGGNYGTRYAVVSN